MLLDQGLGAVSMDGVAERAGVSKATIYRWWPTKEALALDALYHDWAAAQDTEPDTGSLRGDLLALLRPWVRLLRSRPYAGALAALITATHSDPAFAREYQARLIGPRRDHARAILSRAVARGEVDKSVPLEVALDLLYGPIYHRLLHLHAPLTDRFATQVVDLVLAGIAAGPR